MAAYWRDREPAVRLSPEERAARHRAQQLAWHRRDKHVTEAHAKRRRAETWAWLRAYKQTLVCGASGENRAPALEFHHLDPSAKDDRLSIAVSTGWSVRRLQAQIATCVVLCANCHRLLQAGLIVFPE